MYKSFLEWLITLLAILAAVAGVWVLYVAVSKWLTYANAVGFVFGGVVLILGACALLIWCRLPKD